MKWRLSVLTRVEDISVLIYVTNHKVIIFFCLLIRLESLHITTVMLKHHLSGIVDIITKVLLAMLIWCLSIICQESLQIMKVLLAMLMGCLSIIYQEPKNQLITLLVYTVPNLCLYEIALRCSIHLLCRSILVIWFKLWSFSLYSPHTYYLNTILMKYLFQHYASQMLLFVLCHPFGFTSFKT